ncbi:uncharacterized protein LOC135843274 [Planococcus citri]|uniref:uncharacterized protein LOC135843274 n=1 Tax=Planococcus citri TaxID=170843 RepID=UPI0031F8312F
MTSENRLIYQESPTSLREISSLRMALMLWRHKFTDLCSSDGLPSVWFSTKEMIAVSTWIEFFLDPYIPALGKELKMWMDYHSERIFFDSDLGWAVLRCFNHIVCYQSGAINYVATAKKLLQNELLNDMEKFRIACVYCLEEDVKRQWALVWCGRTKGLLNATIKPIIHYWNNRMNKEEHCKHVCFKRIFASYSKCSRNWTATLHFLNELEVVEQIAQAIELIEQDPMFALHVLPHLSVEQQRQVIMKQGVTIYITFAKKSRYSTFALQLWRFFGQFATVFQFNSLIKQVIDDKEIGLRVKTDINRHVGTLLHDTWSSSQYNLKRYIVHNFINDVLNVLFEEDSLLRVTYRDARFLLAVLAATTEESRAKLWNDHQNTIIFNIPPKYLEELFAMCVKDTLEVDRIKTRLSEDVEFLEKYNKLSFKEGYFEDVEDFLTFCQVDRNRKYRIQKDLLTRVQMNAVCILDLNDLEKWCRLDRFVDDCYDEDQATSFRKDMIRSNPMLEHYQKLLVDGQLYQVRQFIDVFLSQDQSSITKDDLIYNCGRSLVFGLCYNFNEANWKEFVNWCFNSDANKIAKWKDSLNIDEIFIKMLRRCVDLAYKDSFFRHRKKNQNYDFVKVNSFLKWYFVTWSAIRNYKHSKIDSFSSIEEIKEAFGIESDLLTTILEWFYDGDREKIHRRKHSAANLSPLAYRVDNWKHKFFHKSN